MGACCHMASSGASVFCHMALADGGLLAQNCRMANLTLQKARTALKLSLEQLSEDVGISVSQLSRFESANRDPRASELLRLAARLNVPAASLLGQDRVKMVPVLGYAAAGSDAVTFFGDGQGPFDEVEAPEGATPQTVAVRVKGTSLGRLFDGWLAFYDDRREPPAEDLAGRVCVCGLADGRVVIKKLKLASGKGRFHLESETEGTMYDVPVGWAAKVIGMKQ